MYCYTEENHVVLRFSRHHFHFAVIRLPFQTRVIGNFFHSSHSRKSMQNYLVSLEKDFGSIKLTCAINWTNQLNSLPSTDITNDFTVLPLLAFGLFEESMKDNDDI